MFWIQCTKTHFQHHKIACPRHFSRENVIITQNLVPNNWHYIVTRLINPFTRNLGDVTASNTYCLSWKGHGNITGKSLSHTPISKCFNSYRNISRSTSTGEKPQGKKPVRFVTAFKSFSSTTWIFLIASNIVITRAASGLCCNGS